MLIIQLIAKGVFLSPIVRYAEWDKAYEYKIKRVRKWPKVEIRHHILHKAEQKELNNLLLALDKSISRIEFLIAGLITDRSDPQGYYYPKENIETPPRSLRIERWNFCQRIELHLGEYTGLNEKIDSTARPIMSFIKDVCKIDNEINYRECYEQNLKEEALRRREWFYRPPAVK
ncbi:MAG: hypothetical protein U0Z26_00025 [Anaerolineales bacterium]